jgi:hypothetical protein
MADYYIQETKVAGSRATVQLFHRVGPGDTRSLCGRVKVARLKPAGDVNPEPAHVCEDCRRAAE